jgi:hypothetical protein
MMVSIAGKKEFPTIAPRPYADLFDTPLICCYDST